MTIQDLVSTVIKPQLRSGGFEPKGTSFIRHSTWKIDVAGIQRASACQPETVSFTINLGVQLPSVYELVWGNQTHACDTARCVLQRRIGEVLAGDCRRAKDVWWTLRSNWDQLVCDEVSDAVRAAINFFDSIHSPEEVAELTRRSHAAIFNLPVTQLYLIAMDYRAGNILKAREDLNELLRKSNNEALAERAQILRAALE